MPSLGTLKKVTAASGLTFGLLFLLLHFICHYSLSLTSWDGARQVVLLLRRIYQHPVIEIPIIMLSLVVHMASNTLIYIKRQKLASRKDDIDRDGNKSKSKRVILPGTLAYQGHQYAGYFLGIFIFGHIFATRVAPLLWLHNHSTSPAPNDDNADDSVVVHDVVDPSMYDYSFVASVGEQIPYYAFQVYLVLLGVAGGWHAIYGAASAVATLSPITGSSSYSIHGKPFPFLLLVVALVSHALIINAVLTLSGFYYKVDLESKSEWHDKLMAAMGIH